MLSMLSCVCPLAAFVVLVLLCSPCGGAHACAGACVYVRVRSGVCAPIIKCLRQNLFQQGVLHCSV